MAYQFQPSHLRVTDVNGIPQSVVIDAFVTKTANRRDMYPTALDALNSTNELLNPLTITDGLKQIWLKTDDTINYTIVSTISGEPAVTTDDIIPVAVFETTVTSPLPDGYLNGLITSNAADTAHDIEIAAGVCRDSTNASNIDLISAIIKRIDSDWVEGNNVGGFPSGLSLANETKYHVFLILKDDNTIDAGFDTSITATNLLADATTYVKYRRVGSVQTNDSQNIEQFTQIGDDFMWNTPIQDYSTIALSTTDVELELSVPIDVQIEASYSVKGTHAADIPYVYIRPLSSSDQAPDATEAPLASVSLSGPDASGQHKVYTDTSGKIGIRSSSTDTTFRLMTLGYTDKRGKA